MALGSEVKRSIRRVADLIGAYALAQGWGLQEIELYYRADPNWGKIEFVLVTDSFASDDEYESYRSVKDYLRRRLSGDPTLFSRIGLVIETSQQVAEGGIYAIGEDYRRVVPRDLPRWVVNQIQGVLAVFAAEHGVFNIGNFGIFYKRVAGGEQVRVILYVFNSEIFPSPIASVLRDAVNTKLSDDPDLLSTIDLEVLDGNITSVDDLDRLLAEGFVAYPSPIGSSSVRGLS